MSNHNNLPDEVAWVLIALLGSISKPLNDWLLKKDRLNFSRIIASAIVGLFTGIMYLQVAIILFGHNVVVGSLFIGVGTWQGGKGLDNLTKYVMTKYLKK